MLTVYVNNVKVNVEEGSTILEAAKKADMRIPTFCHIPEIAKIGACRICMVEVEGNPKLVTSCTTPVTEGMKIITNSRKIREARKFVVELMLSDHPFECLTCERNTRCELQQVAAELGIDTIRFRGAKSVRGKDSSSPSIAYNGEKCIYCKRCESMCNTVQSVGAIYSKKRGFNAEVGTPFNIPFSDSVCVSCGQCVLNCPVAALKDNETIDEVWKALEDPDKITVIQVAPSVRVTLGEEFGFEPGTIVTGKIFASMRKMGFDYIFDTDFSADLTIMEEGYEFIKRVREGGVLPMITSCSPGWVNFLETFFPELIPNLSTCKSPQQMMGAMIKTYFAEKMGYDPKKIVSISVMPCTAKKYEAERPEMGREGYRDVDIAITTREFAKMIKQRGIDFINIAEEEPDNPLGMSTGAGVIFGASGGVMEAALRTALEVLGGHEIPNLDYEAVRGLKLDGVKEASVMTTIDGKETEVRVAVASGLANARALMEKVAEGKANYHFIEIMACPGGCIGGGGQPIPTTTEIRRKRISGIYSADRSMKIRKSHENPFIKKIYSEYLEKPLGHKSHELLHTHYRKKEFFTKI